MLNDLSLFRIKLRAVGQHGFVMRQNISLRLHVQRVDIVVGQVDNANPVAGGINDYRGG